MELRLVDPPRRFRVGARGEVELVHVADVELGDDEQVTFTAATGSEYDVVRKLWGYYATPSLNRRLPEHGLRPTLCANSDGRRAVLLVERGQEAEFRDYLASESMTVAAWLDEEPCVVCGGYRLEPWHRYTEPPEGETVFDLRGQSYVRDLLRCGGCGHFTSVTELDLSGLYEGDYMDATYAGEKLRATYERIMALPPERSDNAQRVDRIVGRLGADGSVLDVGSGLGVFPARMAAVGWRATALDPDQRAIEHARDVIGVEGVQADFLGDPLDALGRYDLVTLNKVLEHVQDPVAMLARTADFLNESGVVYVELPDGEGASEEGPGREEFFIEHLHVFSAASLALMAGRAGFRVQFLDRLREPSSKYTLAAFLSRA
jgi:SAM-dependent methyltransferase